MIRSFIKVIINSEFYLADHTHFEALLTKAGSFLKFIWVTAGTLHLNIDGSVVEIHANQIICCTYLQKIEILDPNPSVYLLMFNREFYCIHTNDGEVSCNGLLFFGSSYSPVLTLEDAEIVRLNTLLDVLKEEFETVDTNQEEMLRILLKRFIIRCTRLARVQLPAQDIPTSQIDLIRKFNVLVEENFKTHKQVAFYADLLHRSPKTLSNLFNRFNERSPLNVILDRVFLEAKRYLIYTDKSIKEISANLGFEDTAAFSKFFKNQEGITASDFRSHTKIL